MTEREDRRVESDPSAGRLEAILERALRRYSHDERHGGASWMGERLLDAALVPITRIAFQDADDMPPDGEVAAILAEPLQLLGEGYHVVALADRWRRVVVKYAKHREGVPPLAPASAQPRPEEWARDHGVRSDGSLHPAIWQHIRSFEAYGPLAATSRVYIAGSVLAGLCDDERRALERFRSIGIVRSLASAPRVLHVRYPDDFPREKQAPEGVRVGVLVLQPMVTPLATAIERALREGDVAAARDLEARYEEFTQELWRCGISHLDFSILNIGIVGSGRHERLQIFDPHMGVIEVADGSQEVRDPLSARPSDERSVDQVLRSARDGSRWALWRVQQELSGRDDVPPEGTAAAAAVVREFHVASEGVEQGRGSFGLERFGRTWRQDPTHRINPVMHAQLWALLRHPVGRAVRAVLAPATPDALYERSVAVLAMDHDGPLAQFGAGVRVYQQRPLLVIVNVSEDSPRLVKHWGRVRLPAELDVQDDPAIHYHLRDLFTGEVYARPGDELVRRGFAVGLAPLELHVLQVEDVVVDDMVVERALALHRDLSGSLKGCTKRVGVVGDVHGELEALKEVLRALGFIDSSDQWFARDGTLVLTGDVGHGRHLQDVFDFIQRLAGQAHASGGRIVWTLGNHDLYVDREGGQGGEDSLGYRLWPKIREAALQPERHPGLVVQAAYSGHGKLFVHGGILPNIVALALRERGAGDADTVASYVNDALRRALVERERIAARDLPHEIFRIGTSHTREPHFPGDIGYEPAGVFTPDLRELDHYRYHDTLLPQVVGHTASRRGEIRYAPGSWLRRDYIAVDVGRQLGTGNGGLLLTDFGWVAVTPGGPAPLVEVAPLFVKLAHEAADEAGRSEHGAERMERMFGDYFRVAKPQRRSPDRIRDALSAHLPPAQFVALEQYLARVRETGRCAVVTGLDEMLTAFSGGDLEHDTIEVLADFLATGGVLVFSTDTSFEWIYARLLRPLVVALGPGSRLLENVLLLLSGGSEIFVYQEGAYRRVPGHAGRDRLAAFEALARLVAERHVPALPEVERRDAVFIGASPAPVEDDPAAAEAAGMVIDVGDAMLETSEKPILKLHRGYQRAIALIAAATLALRDSGRAPLPEPAHEIGDAALWTFEQRRFPAGRRLRVRVRGSGFVHAGVTRPDGRWDPIYDVPLLPLPDGVHQAVLPAGVDVFTFFWTEPPWSPGHPGHWEREQQGGRTFRAEPN